jgi:hypothetical protein
MRLPENDMGKIGPGRQYEACGQGDENRLHIWPMTSWKLRLHYVDAELQSGHCPVCNHLLIDNACIQFSCMITWLFWYE